MSEERSDMETAALALYYYAAELMKEGKTREQIIFTLVERGVSRDAAETILQRLDASVENVQRRRGYRELVFGLVISIFALMPLFGIFVERVQGISLFVTLIVLTAGLVIIGRGLMQVLGKRQ